ncbi:MAG: polymer-forming cytoskeletal protein [Candidatus Aerophobetes bacterium]|nr:polymer-forming cytoskeletal protein [Candidatus Aerophobetes bacterium]
MFRKGKKEGEMIKTNTVIGKGTELKGSLKDEESIRVDGKFEGDIQTKGEVIIGEDGVVRADIKAKSVKVGGKLVGDVSCEGKVELFSSGSLEGKIKASDLTIAEGAFFNGECVMTPVDMEEEKEEELEQRNVEKETSEKESNLEDEG